MAKGKLAGKITEKFGTLQEFAKEMGISQYSIGKKVSKKAQWKSSEIKKAQTLLDIPDTEISEYFLQEQ